MKDTSPEHFSIFHGHQQGIIAVRAGILHHLFDHPHGDEHVRVEISAVLKLTKFVNSRVVPVSDSDNLQHALKLAETLQGD